MKDCVLMQVTVGWVVPTMSGKARPTFGSSSQVNRESRTAIRLPFPPRAGESWIGGNGLGKFYDQGWQLAMPVRITEHYIIYFTITLRSKGWLALAPRIVIT